MFDLNRKVRYENLSPSLQSLVGEFSTNAERLKERVDKIKETIDSYSPQITEQNNTIDTIIKEVETKFSEIKKKASTIPTIPRATDGSKYDFTKEGTTSAISSGFYGQYAKVNGNKGKEIFSHDGFEEAKICTNQSEFDTMSQTTKVGLKEVFDTWYRYAHFNRSSTGMLDNSNWDHTGLDGQNLANPNFTQFTDKTKGAWVYKEDTKEIACTVDSFPTAGFVIPYDGPTSWMMRLRCDTGKDDDNFGIVVGYMKDKNNVEHTLTVVRAAGEYGEPESKMTDAINPSYIDTKFWWGLIYDMGNSTQFFINNLSQLAGHKLAVDNPITYITVVKNYDSLECRTTPMSPRQAEITTDDPTLTFRFSIPDSKPGSWSQEMYDNIKTMLRTTSRMGFMTRSNKIKFRIDKQQYVFDDGLIYRLDNGKAYDYNSTTNKWEPVGDIGKYLTPHTFLYNKKLNRLVYYIKPGIGTGTYIL
jgi:hypothetical protein|nr:MAG TPA: putative virion structural protein [Caudoviricetes sp.]